MFAAALAALSSGMWGVADFLGGVAARRAGTANVLLISYPSGALLLTAVALWVIPGRLSVGVVLIGVMAGVVGLAGLLLLYRALVRGPMGIVSPISAVVAGSVPVSIGLLRGERLGPVAIVGMIGAAVAVVLASLERGTTYTISRTTLAVTLASGLCIGAFLVLIGLVPAEGGIWSVVIARWCSALIIAVIMMATTRLVLPSAYPWVLVLTIGCVDALANAIFQLAAQQGLLSIVAVIGSLYPAATVILAWVVLRERLAPLQAVGVVLALGSAALLATAA